jgi:hypothetical protein
VVRFQVSERITTHPTFTKVADSVKSHQATLVDSIEHLKQYTADAKASIPSHPVVQQAMEALDRASVALTGLKQTAAETGAKITDSLLESIAAARGRAADAVAQAKSQLSVRDVSPSPLSPLVTVHSLFWHRVSRRWRLT